MIQCIASLLQFDGFSEIRHVRLFEPRLFQVFRVGVAGVVLAVDDEDLLQPLVALLAGEVADKRARVARTLYSLPKMETFSSPRMIFAPKVVGAQ